MGEFGRDEALRERVAAGHPVGVVVVEEEPGGAEAADGLPAGAVLVRVGRDGDVGDAVAGGDDGAGGGRADGRAAEGREDDRAVAGRDVDRARVVRADRRGRREGGQFGRVRPSAFAAGEDEEGAAGPFADRGVAKDGLDGVRVGLLDAGEQVVGVGRFAGGGVADAAQEEEPLAVLGPAEQVAASVPPPPEARARKIFSGISWRFTCSSV
ncbi:hypothetical protein [Actinomadura sp. CNU-125]|uniref:hypothetical protein n=1 Tax=Actinomadura sp. CNU-125 TaxID=1904961 RepID=UPI0021CC6526|nr:hypothetical protein [Actinomadura sp. CNU-125]